MRKHVSIQYAYACTHIANIYAYVSIIIIHTCMYMHTYSYIAKKNMHNCWDAVSYMLSISRVLVHSYRIPAQLQ